MPENPLAKLPSLGQSVWLDFIRRGMLESGELAQYIKEDGLRGVTSNPAIFEKAIAGSPDYDAAIRALALEGKSPEQIYETLTVQDVQRAADLFRPIYDQTEGRDGFVSLEVSPKLAEDTDGTILEARKLWQAVNRPNVMIKVPATREGFPAIQQLISEGINVNVTLLFNLYRYREVIVAYMAGLQGLDEAGKPINRVASVASFFLSRIDSKIDPYIEKALKSGGEKAEAADGLLGEIAIASAKGAYQIYKDFFDCEEFKKLEAKGARKQRLLWASTSTKNAAYSDVKYVEALVGPDTVNTMPLETLHAYRDHGQPKARLEENMDKVTPQMDKLAHARINVEAVTRILEEEGVQKFVEAYDQLLKTLKTKADAAKAEPVDHQTLALGSLEKAVQDRVAALEKDRFSARLWLKDGSLWKSDVKTQVAIRNALGWLTVADKMEELLGDLQTYFSPENLREAGFRHVVHMGMGGSSLAPLVFERTFGPIKGGLPLTVLDTTDPATILNVEKSVPLANTLFIVATKSGTTAEPLAFNDYFFDKLKKIKGDNAGDNFVAITDPGTPLVQQCQERRYRRVFLNFADIGGRYSALSYFGLLPAHLAGVNVGELLVRALRIQHASVACVPGQHSPALVLGAAMGELAKQGRDKVTFLVAEPLATLGTWLEQLLAESTGKEGTGLLPVATEAIGTPSVYGNDRLFVHLWVKGTKDDALEKGVKALRDAGQPVIIIQLEDKLDLGQEFLRWEIATAVAGAVLGINAFDQPNVQESKDNTNQLLAEVRDKGKLPEEKPALVEGSLSLYTDQPGGSVAETLSRFFKQGKPGDYVALMAYLAEDPATEKALQAIRLRLRDSLKLATTFGYGPRFLHSTGQFHKGGPNTGLFLQLTADDKADAPCPGQPYTFGTLKRAQAMGDLKALAQHQRRALRIHLGADVAQGLAALAKAVEAVLR